jgi:hypothetical protein
VENGHPYPTAAKAATLLLSLRPIMGDLSHGNVNLFILFLVTAALYAFQGRRDLLAGISLALAISCKLTPALFLPYFLWKRAWTTLAGCALGLLLFLVVVPACFLGMSRNIELLTSWYDGMVRPFVQGGEVTTEHINQSLPGLVFRMTTHSPSFYEKGVPQNYDNVVDLSPRTAGWLVKGGMAVFAALLVWTCRTPIQTRHGWRLAAEYSLIMLGMLLFSERTWKHHCVILLLPFAVLVYHLAACRPGRQIRAYLVATLTAVLLLMGSTVTGFGANWDRWAKMAEVMGAYVWCYLLLAAALAIVLRSPVETVPHAEALPKAA